MHSVLQCTRRDLLAINKSLLILQVSRSIGDAYLKKAEFNKEPLLAKFRLPEPFDTPILKAEPAILVQKINPEDQFLIFASDGLWEHLTNQEAVDIVNTCPRSVWFSEAFDFFLNFWWLLHVLEK